MIKEVAGVRIYGTEDIAQELGVSVLTVRAWIRAGRIRATKIGRGWKVTEDALRAFIAGEGPGPRPAPVEEGPPAPEIPAEDPTPETPAVKAITETTRTEKKRGRR